MGQLAGRLKELVREHAGDEGAFRSAIDAIAALEKVDVDRAHERFVAERSRLFLATFRALLDRFAARPWIADVPYDGETVYEEREVQRAIRDLERADRLAREIERVLAEARTSIAWLRERRLAIDFASFERVPYAKLAHVAKEAEDLRRRTAREAGIESRWRSVSARARKLRLLPLEPAALPSDGGEASAALDALEKEIAAREGLIALHDAVVEPLSDAAVREYKAETRKKLLAETSLHLAARERGALEKLATVAIALREEAAKASEAASCARRRGAKGPERERKAGDLQDFYG